MTFERRDFLKLGTIGMTAAMATPAYAFNDDSAAKGKGELEGGCSSIRLEGQLKAGHIVIEARAFEDGKDRTMIMHSTLNNVDLYSSVFSYDLEKAVFAVFRDNGHSTSLLVSNTDDPKIGRLIVWNDSEAPGVFEVNKEKFMSSENLKDTIRDLKGNVVDVVGKRNPPAFTWRELEAVFGDDPALNEFMRGRKSHHKGGVIEFACRVVSAPANSTSSIGWYAGGQPL